MWSKRGGAGVAVGQALQRRRGEGGDHNSPCDHSHRPVHPCARVNAAESPTPASSRPGPRAKLEIDVSLGPGSGGNLTRAQPGSKLGVANQTGGKLHALVRATLDAANQTHP